MAVAARVHDHSIRCAAPDSRSRSTMNGCTRRTFMLSSSVLGSAAGGAGCAATATAPMAEAPLSVAGESVTVNVEVNGTPRRLVLDARTTLLDALREHLDLTGTKKGCDQG